MSGIGSLGDLLNKSVRGNTRSPSDMMSEGPTLVLPQTMHVGPPQLHATTISAPMNSTNAKTSASVMASFLAPIAAQGTFSMMPNMTSRSTQSTDWATSVMQTPQRTVAQTTNHFSAGTVHAPVSSSSPTAVDQVPSQNRGCAEVIYLHGFGATQPERTVIAHMVKRAAEGSGARCHCPCYHPGGDVKATRIGQFLAQLRSLALSLPGGRFSVIVGFSVGGLIAALFQEQYPELVGSVVLIAPAIDNYERNFRDVPKTSWQMPSEYVEELARFPARPVIKVPATLLHGMSDFDGGADMPARVREWASQARFEKCFFPDTLNHFLEPWISSESPGLLGIPSLKEMMAWALHVGGQGKTSPKWENKPHEVVGFTTCKLGGA